MRFEREHDEANGAARAANRRIHALGLDREMNLVNSDAEIFIAGDSS